MYHFSCWRGVGVVCDKMKKKMKIHTVAARAAPWDLGLKSHPKDSVDVFYLHKVLMLSSHTLFLSSICL